MIYDIYDKLNEAYLIEMAMSRNDAISKCASLGKMFIKHFDKIYKEPNNTDVITHWASEMSDWYKEIREIRLKQNLKPILKGNLRDWFFTACALPEDFMENPSDDELEKYDEFVNNLIMNDNVYESLKLVGFNLKDVN